MMQCPANVKLEQVMTIPAVLRLGITLHSAVREVAALFGRSILSGHEWMQKERARACFVFIPYGKPRLGMAKAAVPEFYRQTMFEPEFLTTARFCFFLEYREYRHEIKPICCRRIQDAPRNGRREE